MTQNKIWLVALISVSLFACNQSASTNESKTSTDSVAAKKDQVPPPKDTTNISIGPSGVGVSSQKADVNVNDTGASVKTGKVKVTVKNDSSK